MDLNTRAVGIVIHANKVLLMERHRGDLHFYVFPGGGKEENETVEEAVERELFEETSIRVTVSRLLYSHFYEDGQDQQYFLCEYLSGEPKLGEFNEYEVMKEGSSKYIPVWIDIRELDTLLLYPLEIRDWLIEDLQKGFSKEPRIANLRIDQLRQSL